MKEKDNKEKARELYQSGYGSLAKIAKTLGENPNTVKAWKKRDKEKGADWMKMGAVKVAPKKEMGAPKEEEIKKVAKIKKKKIKVLEDKLTEKQRLFAYYYIQSFNITQSAIKAGYSVKTAHEIGSVTLKNVMVRELVAELREGFNEELHLDANRILNRHANIAMSDMKDYVSYGMKTESIVTYDDEGKASIEDIERFKMEMKESDEVDGTLIKKVKMGKFGIEFELEDRSKSLEFLTKYAGLDKMVSIAEEKLKIDKVRVKIDIEKHTGAGKGKNKLADAVKKNHKKRIEADD